MFTATVTPAPDSPASILVTAFNASGEVAEWQVPAKKAALAKRLVRAVEAGKVVTFDKDGVKHINVMGRYLDSDLKRLGF
jgi:hypothetical protein